MPEFEYDPKKSRANLLKHGVDFDDAQDLWARKHLLLDAREVAGEKRYAIVGRIRERPWVAFFTLRGDIVRIISCRRAEYALESLYASFFEEPKA